MGFGDNDTIIESKVSLIPVAGSIRVGNTRASMIGTGLGVSYSSHRWGLQRT